MTFYILGGVGLVGVRTTCVGRVGAPYRRIDPDPGPAPPRGSTARSGALDVALVGSSLDSILPRLYGRLGAFDITRFSDPTALENASLVL
jgi:hypothetical protein